MSTWLDVVTDSRGVTAIYGANPPTLEGIALHEFSLHRDGPSARFRFDLRDYPEEPPRKWSAHGYNVVQIALTMAGLQDVSLRSWSHQIRASLSLRREGSSVVAQVMSDSVRLDVRADAAVLTSISAYQDRPHLD